MVFKEVRKVLSNGWFKELELGRNLNTHTSLVGDVGDLTLKVGLQWVFLLNIVHPEVISLNSFLYIVSAQCESLILTFFDQPSRIINAFFPTILIPRTFRRQSLPLHSDKRSLGSPQTRHQMGIAYISLLLSKVH